jgi:hypothetical protein
MKFYFAIVSLALFFAAATGGALLWDGSYYLYCALNSGHACVSNNRWITLFLHFPVVVASRIIDDVHTLQLIFGLTYALVPLVVLLVCWWIVRESAPHLFVWAALGVGVGTLFLQLHFVAEAIISVQLAWPLFLAQWVPGRKRIHLTVAILPLLLLISHPFAIGLFALIGVAAILSGWKTPDLRREKWAWASIWITLTIIALARLIFTSSAYEAERISFSVFAEGFNALRGLPGIALLSVFVAAASVFLSSRRVKGFQRGREIQAACMILATSLLIIWATQPQAWNSSFSYRVVAPFASLPFFVLAGLDGLFPLTLPGQSTAPVSWRSRLLMIQTIGVAFTLTLCIQSGSWYQLQRQLLAIITESPSACISLSDVSSQFEQGQMPFHHWSVTTLSLFLQGNVPQKVIMENPCETIDFSRRLPVNGWEFQGWGTTRIFDLSELEDALK